MLVNDIKNKITKIGKKYELDKIFLFGSVARGTDKSDSDIDFYAISSKPISLVRHSNIISDCKEIFNKPVDFIIYDGVEDEFMKNIHKDEKLVYER